MYVLGGGSTSTRVVDVFAGEAGGREPALLGQIRGPETPCVAGEAGCVNPTTREPCKRLEAGCVAVFVEPHGVAVSPVNGDVLVSDGPEEECSKGKGECVVDVFEPTGIAGRYSFMFKILGVSPQEPFKYPDQMAVDGEGDIYVVEHSANVVDQFNAAGPVCWASDGHAGGPLQLSGGCGCRTD